MINWDVLQHQTNVRFHSLPPFCFTNSVKFIIDSLTMIWTLIISFLIWLMVNSSVRYGKTGILVYTFTSISSTETPPSSSLREDCKCCSINIIHSIIICFSHEILKENSVWRKDVRQLTADDGYLHFLNVLLLSYSSLFIFFLCYNLSLSITRNARPSVSHAD